LDEARSDRIVVQDYRPLAESLDWELGQEYLRRRGSLAFIGDAEPVPFVVNNDGNLSIKAAEVFFTSLQAAEQKGALEPDIFVLELGIGVGLFARYFLDWFRRLCDQAGKDWYDRLTYVAADRSARMLRDAGRHGVFQDHPGRYRLRLADALCPEKTLLADADIQAQGPRPFRAVFLNYLLDCLPASVLRIEGEQVQQLHVRTCLPRGADWRPLLDAREDELRQLGESPDAKLRNELLAVYPHLVAEYQYRPASAAELPYAAFALEQARQAGGRPVLHSHGALRCLESLLGLLAEGGFVLVNDYGQTKEVAAEEFEHQRFSLATFVGVNFPLLGAYFSGKPDRRWVEPDEGDTSVHARLLGPAVTVETQLRFQECFSKKAQEWLEGPAKRARELAKVGRLQAALGQYRVALERQPCSWVLMNEVAHFLTIGLRSLKSGLEMAKAALRQNPGCSPDLWNTLGDCLFEMGRFQEARLAFERALAISADDVRGRYNLAFVHVQAREYDHALGRIAEALARDKSGAYHERLLQKQKEVLTLLAQQNQRSYLGQADRISATAGAGRPGRGEEQPPTLQPAPVQAPRSLEAPR
jgi:tetratricopeptide (TPR) repeat protein